MSNTSTPDKKETPPSHKAQDVARESDGSNQCIPYPGWKQILERLARRSA